MTGMITIITIAIIGTITIGTIRTITIGMIGTIETKQFLFPPALKRAAGNETVLLAVEGIFFVLVVKEV
jgi:hypothetical protein